jgi:hypothetical protein
MRTGVGLARGGLVGGASHCTVFSKTGSNRPDYECQDAGKKAVPEHAVFPEACDSGQERDEESSRPD